MKKFTKVISLVLATLFVVACFAGCSSNTATEEKGNVLKVGFDQDGFEPFGYTNDSGEWVGFDLDLAKACVENMDGYSDIQLVPIAWENKDAEMAAGNVDVIWNGFTMHVENRDDTYEWTKAYMNNSQVVVVADDSDINTLDDLSGKIVGTQKDSSGLAALKDNTELTAKIANGEPMQFDGYETAIMELQAGSVDALVIDEQVIKVKIANGDVTGYKILDEALSTEEYGVAAKKGNTELVEQLNTALDTLAENGKMAEISKTYFGYDATVWAK